MNLVAFFTYIINFSDFKLVSFMPTLITCRVRDTGLDMTGADDAAQGSNLKFRIYKYY